MVIEQIQIHFPRYAPSVICNILQRDAECAARWQVEKHLPRLPCSDGLPDGGCVDGAAILNCTPKVGHNNTSLCHNQNLVSKNDTQQ